MLRKIKSLFTDHPNRIGETYLQHLAFALKFSMAFFCLGLIVFIHSFFPFLFQNSGSDKIEKINRALKEREW